MACLTEWQLQVQSQTLNTEILLYTENEGGQPLSFQRGRGGSSVVFLSGVHIPLVFPMFSSSCTTPFVAIVIHKVSNFLQGYKQQQVIPISIQARLRWHTYIQHGSAFRGQQTALINQLPLTTLHSKPQQTTNKSTLQCTPDTIHMETFINFCRNNYVSLHNHGTM